jgi:transmembrane sensor
LNEYHMKITIELVIAFFEDKCSKEEAEAIHRYLVENPGLLHDFFPEEEWMAFQGAEDLPQKWSQKVWKKIQAGKTPVTGRVRFMNIIRIAAAAMAVIAVGIFAFKQYAGGKADPGVKLASIPSVENRDTVLTNQTTRIRKDTLTDGSVVELFPASRLRFHWNFDGDKRSIILSGEALFNVARETHRPFTVITRGFTTTVLGTVFRIKAYTDKNTANVRLLKGKIVVRSLTHPSQAEFLLEGQECTFDNGKDSLSMSAVARPAIQMSVTDTGLPVDSSQEETDREVLFRHMPLPRVFTILSKTYHAPILFINADLRKRNFTGSIEKDEPLEDALNTIAQLNDLLVIRQDGSYRITLRQ